MLFTFGKHDRKYTTQYKIDNNKIDLMFTIPGIFGFFRFFTFLNQKHLTSN